MEPSETQKEPKEKKKQGPKPGKVVRVDPTIWKLLNENRRKGETISALIRRLLGLPSKKGEQSDRIHYVLPSQIHATIEEARGSAVIAAVKTKQKPERPVAVILYE